MAHRDRKGKTVDRSTRSTGWSELIWDDRGFWFKSRTNSAGETEYDYRYPEGAQTPEQQQTTPRFPGPNIITSPNTYYSPLESPSGSTYTTQINSTYTATPATPATPATTLPYDNNPEYPHADTSAYNTTYYATASVTSTQHTAQSTPQDPVHPSTRPESSSSNASTVRSALTPVIPSVSPLSRTIYSVSTSGYDTTVATGAEALNTAFQELSVSPPLTISEQAYGTSPPQQDWYMSPSLPSSSAELDQRYCAISQEKEKKFWRIGRVFMALWTEPARVGLVRDTSHGAQGGPSTSSQVSDVYLSGKAFTEIRRFVVVGEGWGNSICSPIHTYNGQATLKPNLPESQQHAIIHTSPEPPDEYWYTAANGTQVRENLRKDPIKVRSEQPGLDGDLGTRSRLNYSKIYTVEHYVRVRNIGMVDKEHIETLQQSCFVKRRESPEKPRKHPPRNDPKGDDKKGKGKGQESRNSREKERKHTRR